MVPTAGAFVLTGAIAVLAGYGSSIEYLEFPAYCAPFFAVPALGVLAANVKMYLNKQIQHTYVSQWYLLAATVWFPIIYVTAMACTYFGLVQGVSQAITNWWFGHNVLGLFYTPLALASIYYFLPKVIGRPVQSYNLSLLGFWGLAFFYGQVGGHHLIGGPVPGWLVTLSIVQSIMMIVPVVAFTVNQYQTLKGHFSALRYSPTLRDPVTVVRLHSFGTPVTMASRPQATIPRATRFSPAHWPARSKASR